MRRPGRPTDAPELKRQIIDAAAEAFSQSGYDGARIERIAKQAGCTRALVYFYFKDKPALFEAVLNDTVERRTAQMEALPASLADGLVYWFGMNMAEPRRIRLVMQEALAGRTMASKRATYLEEQLKIVQLFQHHGLLRRDIEPRKLLLIVLALTSFPACLPAVSGAVLGTAERDAFIAEWSACLRQVARILSPGGS
ncbi:MAG TPA: TetR/AcrR family transcriptional regulator [Rhizomicrobium sp.]|nr:TetR/AcrR family transcriptional regulator [Rhizomicrobium sp.]